MDCKKVIKKFLVDQDSNTAELARRLGCGTSNLYDKYRRNTWSVAELERVAEAYGFRLSVEFVKDTGES